MIAGALEIQLVADVARIRKDMADAKGVVTTAMDGIGSAVGTATKLLGVFGVGLSLNYFKNFVTGAITAQDELAKMSQRIGVSVDRLAGLEHAAGMSGTSLGSVEKALKTVSSGLVDADRGLTGAQQNFDALGVSIYDTNGALKSADAVMIEVADQFAVMEDGTQKTALATKLFGKAGLELIPMLNEGSAGLATLVAEGQKYNPVTAESAAQAEIFNDNLDRLTGAGKSVGLTFVNKLLPALSGFSQWAVDFVNGDTVDYMNTMKAAATGLAIVIATKMVPAFATLAGPIGIATTAVVALIAAYDNLQRITNTAHENSVANNIANGSEVITFAMYNVVQEINKAAAAMDELGGGRSGRAKREQLDAEIVKLTAELERYAFALADTKIPAETAASAAAGAAVAVYEYGEDIKFTIDAHDAHVEALEAYREEQDKAREANNKARESIGKTIAELDREMLALQMTARAAAVFEAVTRATAEGALPAEIAQIATATARLYDMKEAKVEATAAAGTLQKAIETAAKAAAENWQRTHEYLSAAFVDIMNNGGNAFDNIAKAFERMVQRMVAEWAASGLMGILSGNGLSGFTMSALTGGNSGVGSLLGSILGGGGPAPAMTPAAVGAGGALGGVAAAAAGGTSAAGVGAVAAGGAASGGGILAGAGAALSSAGSSIMTGLAAIPGWGWALVGAALAAKILDDSGTMSGNAGFLIHDVTGASDRTFDVPAFDSGFDPTGFARREDRAAAVQVIDVFRADDAALNKIAEAAGINVNYANGPFNGYNEKGNGAGVFIGSANEDGRNTSVSLEQQRTQFVSDWIRGLGGQVDPAHIADVLAQGSANDMIIRAAQIAGIDGSHRTGLDYVPFDGYLAQLHKGERVQTEVEARNTDSMGIAFVEMRAELSGIRQELIEIKRTNKSMSDIAEKEDAIGILTRAA